MTAAAPARWQHVPRRPPALPLLLRLAPPVLLLVGIILAGQLLATRPFWVGVGTDALTLAIAAVGLNVLVGYTGLLSLGHAGFFVAGGYAGAIAAPAVGLPTPLGFLLAAAVGAVLGGVLALLCCHLRGFYLTVVTLGFAGLLPYLTTVFPGTLGGPGGRRVEHVLDARSFPTGGHWLNAGDNRGLVGLYYVAALVLLVSLLLCRNLVRSRWGRAFTAVRDGELAARASGVRTYWYKVAAFAVSAAIVAVAGWLRAEQTTLATPMAAANAVETESFRYVVFVVVGGAGTLAGPVVGAVAFVVVLSTRWARDAFRDYQALLYGALALLFVAAAPVGIAVRLRDVARRLFGGRAPAPAPDDEAPAAAAVTVPTEDEGDDDGVLLDVQGASRRFGGVTALDGVDLQVRSRTVHALIGPNGSGKTTLLDVVSGLTAGTGRVCFGRDDITGWSTARRSAAGIARTFQHLQVWRRMTVLDNVLVGTHARRRVGFVGALLRTRRARRTEATAVGRAHELLEFVGLGRRAHDEAGALPLVDQRRLEIARALASEPRLLLLDEPAAGLAQSDVELLVTLIARLREEGLTVLVVEHHVDVVMRLADVVTVLDEGVKLAEGPPAQVRADARVLEAYLGGGQDRDGREEHRTAARATGGEPLLTVRDLHVRYGAALALQGVDLDVFEGETVALVGANGAGKSTVLKTVSGLPELLKSVRGTMTFGGRRIDRAPAHRIARLGVAHVPEGRRVFATSTVEENLLLGAHRRHDHDQVRREVDDAYERFPILGRRRDQPAGLLSGGEQQQLALARALLARPRLLLLDEPSLGLAPRLVAELLAVVAELAAAGTTILLVEQLATVALDVADRGYVLEAGRVVAEGDAGRLRDDPRVRAAYVGAAADRVVD